MIMNLIFRTLRTKMVLGSPFIPSLGFPFPRSDNRYFYSSQKSGQTSKSHKQERSKEQFLKKSKLSVNGYLQKSKTEDEQIATIIRKYRTASRGGDDFIQVFSETCKLLSNFYRQENHESFLKHIEEINRIVLKIHTIDFESLTFIEFLNILDFFRVAVRLETVNRSYLEKSKKMLFSIINRYIAENNDLAPLESFAFFSKLTPLNYPQIDKISVTVLKHLQQTVEEGSHSIPPFQYYILIKAFSKKYFLSHLDKQIIKICLTQLYQRQSIDNIVIVSLFKALIDLHPKANISDHQVLQIIDHFQKTFQPHVVSFRKISFLKFLAQCPPNEDRHYYSLIIAIYHRILKKIGHKSNTDLLTFISDLSKHLKPEDIKPEHQRLIIDSIIEAHKSQVKLRMEFELVALINNGFFHSEIEMLDKLIEDPEFDLSWTLPYTYSQKGYKFPLSRILIKGERGVIFREDPNFVKAALTVAIQLQLRPDSQELKALYQKAVESIKDANWRPQSSQWLVKLTMYHPKLIRSFTHHYGQLFLSKIKPSKEAIQKDLKFRAGDYISEVHYWSLLFTITKFDETFPSQLAYSLPARLVTFFSLKQKNRINLDIDYKPFLLVSLYIKFQQNIKSPNSKECDLCIGELLNLMVHYSRFLIKADEGFLELYFKAALALSSNYSVLKPFNIPQANFIFMNLLTIENQKIKHSQWMHQLIKELNNNTIIFCKESKYDHIQNAIIRSGFQNNTISQLSASYANMSFLSTHEQLELQAFKGKLDQKIQNFSLLLKSKNISQIFLTTNSQKLNQSIQLMSVTDLSKCLIHYSLVPSVSNNEILLKIIESFTQKLKDIDFDFVSILENIHERLYQLSPDTLHNLLRTISEKIQQKLSAFLVVDHCKLMNYLNNYDVLHEEYEAKVLEYALENDKRGSSLIDVVAERSRNTLLSDPQINLIEPVSIVNLQQYLTVLALYDESLEVRTLLEAAANKQIEPVPDSHIVRYLEKKYSIAIDKKSNDTDFFKGLNGLGRQMMTGLGEQAPGYLKVEDLGDGPVFLLGKTALLILVNPLRKEEKRVTEKILRTLFPDRKLICKHPNLNIMDIQQLLHQLSSDLFLGHQIVNTIMTRLKLS